MSRNYNIQGVVPLTPIVKRLIILNVSLWIVLVLIVQNLFMEQNLIFAWFGLIPGKTVQDFWIWQPFTYMFLHSPQILHILFNMLLLWWLGADLEQRWGWRFFLSYYMVCGVGAAFIYLFCIFGYYAITGNFGPLGVPVVGASGAIFGLLLAYGMLFGERIFYFMMIFPMRAKYMVMILGAVELFTLIGSGVSGDVANLAHLGGLVSGFLFLIFYTRFKGRKLRKQTKKRGRNLKLVVDNERNFSDKGDGPKYWN